ncbi:MAG: HAD family hydrolase [Erysipelotrichia bacterium]|nr:HAD family hydrolase [Erysipelotrichia bacterium]NCC53883.1 HAD family hydrolase [Erysipelotrichia bacterium]
MIKTILFDLDGTLLPMDLDAFIKVYFQALQIKFAKLGYDHELILKGVIAGTKAMIKNDGSMRNEEVFWQTFTQVTNISKKACEHDFEAFYKDEFVLLGKHTSQSNNMCEALKLLSEKGYRLLLTTNPMFPKMAVEERVRWAGVDASLFSMMTSYEYCHYTKPNIHYYEEVIQKENLKVEECMMVGNDTIEDGVIESLGIPLYLVEDHLINRNNDPIRSTWHGTSESFLTFVKALPSLK